MSEDSRSQEVSLGCGTLILIALIVLIFSNRGSGKLENEVQRLSAEVAQLKEMIAKQSQAIKKLAPAPTP
jgi:hypothetical protein